MRYRVLIFEDDDTIRPLLKKYVDKLGYEVFSFPDPSLCPLHEKEVCECSLKSACSDVIISDINMPTVKGTEFINQMMKKGCKVKHIAIMSGVTAQEETIGVIEKLLGIKMLQKPFQFEVLQHWLKECENVINENRKLSSWIVDGKNQ